jgi:hypothetical protein
MFRSFSWWFVPIGPFNCRLIVRMHRDRPVNVDIELLQNSFEQYRVLVASVIARYSASLVDSDTALCFFECHWISDDPRKSAIPEVYFREFVSPA